MVRAGGLTGKVTRGARSGTVRVVWLVSLPLLPAPAASQDVDFLRTGDLVRAARAERGRAPRWMTGRVLEVNVDNVLLASVRSERTSFSLSWSWMNRLEVSRGRKTKTVSGLIAGTLAGAAVGATAGWIRDTRVNDLTTRQSVRRGTVIGAFAGLVVGGVIGTLSRGERWEDVSPRIPDLRVGTGSRGGLVALVLHSF